MAQILHFKWYNTEERTVPIVNLFYQKKKNILDHQVKEYTGEKEIDSICTDIDNSVYLEWIKVKRKRPSCCLCGR